ncbi:YqaA family protein [Hahella sp. NBU794]|uniref:YqaA family protein n=1 Tax=Hahella sp. NBU794 TaxID=3422590 RepID=UPI003D7001D8
MEAYFSLFFIAFLAATLVPAYSEIMLAGLLATGYDPALLWVFATVGNTLGSVVNWALGRYLLHFKDRRWFPFKEKNLGPAQGWFQRYGVWSLLMAWAPLFGDALTFIAGLMRIRLPIFVFLTFAGKGARYAIIVGLFDQFGAYFQNTNWF